jgi:hypothetical protein
MKITVWTLASDDDNGTQTAIFSTEHEAQSAFWNVVFSDNEEAGSAKKAKAALNAGDYDELHDIAQRYLEGSLDTYNIDEHTIEVSGAPAKAVVVLEGGLVRDVVSTIPLSVAVIDYDTEDAEDADIKRIPQGEGKFEDGTGHISKAYVLPERCEELYKAIDDETEQEQSTREGIEAISDMPDYEKLLAELKEAQTTFWNLLNQLEGELGVEIDSSKDLAGYTIADLQEGA